MLHFFPAWDAIKLILKVKFIVVLNTARLGAKQDFEVWTDDSDNSTQIKCLLVLGQNDPILISQILPKCNAVLAELILQCGQPPHH